jgi:hypothetical protein
MVPCWEDRTVVPDSIRDFFVASGGVAGTLIGLLFVAISISSDRLTRKGAGAQIHRIRASAALTAFSNALVVSLFALIPGQKIAWAAASGGVGGLMFIAAALLSLIRLRQVRWSTVRDALFLLGLGLIFVFQLIEASDVFASPGDSGAVNTIAILLVLCFTIGVARSWELIGAPSIGLMHEVTALVRNHEHGADEPGDEPQKTE